MSTPRKHLFEFVGTLVLVCSVIFLAMYYHAHSLHKPTSSEVPTKQEAEKESEQEPSSIPSALESYYETKNSIYYHF
jgi:hypothetical protein